jgi:hypothetical protein
VAAEQRPNKPSKLGHSPVPVRSRTADPYRINLLGGFGTDEVE